MHTTDPAPAPWPTMRGNPQNTGCWGFGPPLRAQAVVLRRALPGGILNATPIVDAYGTAHVGSSDGYLYALGADGTWSHVPVAAGACQRDADPPRAVVDSAACYLPTGLLCVPGGDRALYHRAPGQSLERFELKAQLDSPSTIDWLEGNVTTDGHGHLYAGCDNFFFYACQVDGAQLKPRWSFATGFFIWSAAAFSADGSMGCFASADMTVYAFDPRQDTPTLLWTAPLDNLCASSPAITRDGRVVVGAFDGRVVCLDAHAQGKRLASVDTPALIYASPALYEQDDLQQMFVLSSDGVLRGYDLRDRSAAPSLMWERFTGMPSFSSPVVGPDPDDLRGYRVYVATGDGVVLAIAPATGAVLGQFDVAGQARGPHDQGHDPAFWTSVQYPAINASLALSPQGVVAVTSGGIVARIPYDAFGASPVPPQACGLRYVSPAGRMARQPLDPQTPLTVDGGQLMTLASLGADGFAYLQPADLQVRIDQQAQPFALSADGTLVHLVVPVDRPAFALEVLHQGRLLGSAPCQLRPVAAPPPAAALLGRTWSVSRMSVFSPFVVPAFDQLAIATIRIALTVLHVGAPDDTGSSPVWVYGCEHYAEGNAGSPARDLMYLFQGHYRAGMLVLEARDVYFELSALPIALDSFRLTAVLDGETQRGVSLSATYRKSLPTTFLWLYNLVHKWLAHHAAQEAHEAHLAHGSHDRESAAGHVAASAAGALALSGTPAVGLRVFTFLKRLVGMGLGPLMRPWKLLDRRGAFIWAGTYALDRHDPDTGGLQVAPEHCDFRWPYLHMQATWSPPASPHEPPVTPYDHTIGIVLLDADSGEPLDLPYTTLNQVPVIQGSTVRCTLIWNDTQTQRLGWQRRLVARMMIGPHVAEGEYAFQLPQAVQR